MTESDPTNVSERGSASIPDDRERIGAVEGALMRALERRGFPTASIFAIRLAFEEAVTNALRHGHRELPGEEIRVEWTVAPHEVLLVVEDKGPGFDPARIDDPTLQENIEKTSGRGLLLIRAYMTDVRFNERGNRVEMRYTRPA